MWECLPLNHNLWSAKEESVMNFFVTITINNEIYMRININVFVSAWVSVWCLVLGVTLPTLLRITYSDIFAIVQYFVFVPWSIVKRLHLHTHREGTSFAPASFLIESSVRSAHTAIATNSQEQDCCQRARDQSSSQHIRGVVLPLGA